MLYAVSEQSRFCGTIEYFREHATETVRVNPCSYGMPNSRGASLFTKKLALFFRKNT